MNFLIALLVAVLIGILLAETLMRLGSLGRK